MPRKAPTHKPKRPHLAERRPSAAKRGYGRRWREYRDWYLNQPENVMCRTHGCTYLASVVDHIIPHRGDEALFWDPANHQPLCKQCHDRKTAREDGGFGRGTDNP